MDSPPVTRVECSLQMASIHEKLDEGFGGINRRLDSINGRTTKNENRLNILADRLGTGKQRAITMWDIILVFGAVGITVEFLTKILGFHK